MDDTNTTPVDVTTEEVVAEVTPAKAEVKEEVVVETPAHFKAIVDYDFFDLDYGDFEWEEEYDFNAEIESEISELWSEIEDIYDFMEE